MNDETRILIDLAQQGDEQAFLKINKMYKDSIYRYIRSIINNNEDAEDILQETFYKAFKSIARFNLQYSFYKWILKIASNTCIDFLRKKKLPTVPIKKENKYENEESEIQIIDPFNHPEIVLKQKRIREKLEKEINLLPKTYRDIIILRFFEQFSYEEISDKLNIPQGTVKTRLFRGREILKEKFSGWS